jgi:hypothetical protein
MARTPGELSAGGRTERCRSTAASTAALKFKAWVIEQWLETNLRGRARHAIGYNAGETGRIARSEYAFGERIAFGFNADERNRISRSCEYNTLSREAF